MFCPQCGTKPNDDLKFCNLCGANLYAVRQVVATREVPEKFDWTKTWVAEMFMSESERKRRVEEIERQRGITPEIKRYTEIKAGVITSCVGIGLTIFLSVFFDGLIRSGNIGPSAIEIVRTLWVVGIIPIFVGLALFINGLWVSKRLAQITSQKELAATPEAIRDASERPALPSPNTREFEPPEFSVTDQTTRALRGSGKQN